MIKKLKSKKLFVIVLVLLGVFVLGNIIYTGFMYYPNLKAKISKEYDFRYNDDTMPHLYMGVYSHCRHNVSWTPIGDSLVFGNLKVDDLCFLTISCEDEKTARKLERQLKLRSVPSGMTKYEASVWVITTPRVLQHAWIFNPFKKYEIWEGNPDNALSDSEAFWEKYKSE